MAKKTTKPGDAYYDALRQEKMDAGLSLADAIEVTARQRKTDEAFGVTLESEEEETKEPSPKK